ncbi:cell wall assembly regulator SMI1 [Rhodococcus sp. 27YEA15]|uniref:hypothetical protein n=1 Tax=Rhodococcus sp. 27YEA15 TaxID=3156259 RepID=UPI003C7AAEAF
MSVAYEWERIVAWCEKHAPVTAAALQPGSTADVVDKCEASTDLVWPGDLKDLYRVQNGSITHDDETGLFLGSVLPDKFLYPIDVAVEVRLALLESWDDTIYDNPDRYAEDEMDQRDRDDAGTAAAMFIPTFMPFAGLDEYHYFTDTRAGALRECVTEYGRDTADGGGPIWASISVMLAAHADALENGSTVGVWKPLVANGVLEWEVDA